MNRQTVFCPECRQDVIYVVKEKRESAELKGDLYEFMAISRSLYKVFRGVAGTSYCQQGK
jgi:uncharacterized protein YbaR (Trm112 family)